MADSSHSEQIASAPVDSKGKGKGKSTEQNDVADLSMDDEESGEDSGNEEVHEEAEEDNLEEIDPDNIITDGRRTRGKQIDWDAADKKAKEADDGDMFGDEDDDDDEDFEGEADDDDMKD